MFAIDNTRRIRAKNIILLLAKTNNSKIEKQPWEGVNLQYCFNSPRMMKFAIALSVWASLGLLATASIYPEGEDKESWDARINAKIDRIHKRNVQLSIDIPEELRGASLRLRVNQTKTPVPFGKHA